MSISVIEEKIHKESAEKALAQMKELEKKYAICTQRFKNGAVVTCKSKERLNEYAKIYK